MVCAHDTIVSTLMTDWSPTVSCRLRNAEYYFAGACSSRTTLQDTQVSAMLQQLARVNA